MSEFITNQEELLFDQYGMCEPEVIEVAEAIAHTYEDEASLLEAAEYTLYTNPAMMGMIDFCYKAVGNISYASYENPQMDANAWRNGAAVSHMILDRYSAMRGQPMLPFNVENRNNFFRSLATTPENKLSNLIHLPFISKYELELEDPCFTEALEEFEPELAGNTLDSLRSFYFGAAMARRAIQYNDSVEKLNLLAERNQMLGRTVRLGLQVMSELDGSSDQ